VTCPPIEDYSAANSPAVVVRQIGDAWDQPFGVVYEPHFSTGGSTVTNVAARLRSRLDGCGAGGRLDSWEDSTISKSWSATMNRKDKFLSHRGQRFARGLEAVHGKGATRMSVRLFSSVFARVTSTRDMQGFIATMKLSLAARHAYQRKHLENIACETIVHFAGAVSFVRPPAGFGGGKAAQYPGPAGR
jgi:hypothetical protein